MQGSRLYSSLKLWALHDPVRSWRLQIRWTSKRPHLHTLGADWKHFSRYVRQSPSNHGCTEAYSVVHSYTICTPINTLASIYIHARINMWLTRISLVHPPKPTYRVLARADTHTCSHTWAAWSPPQKSRMTSPWHGCISATPPSA